jgi:hypothetical protein
VQWGIENRPQSRFDLRAKQTQLFETRFPGVKVDPVVNGSDLNRIKATPAAGTVRGGRPAPPPAVPP